MYSHDGTWDFLKMVAVMFFTGLAVWWLQGAIGRDYTVLVIFALVGVILFAAGALFAHMNQKQTLDALTRFNHDDARIDAARMGTYRALATGDAAMSRAAAQLTVLDAKRVDRLADQRAKLLTDTEREKWFLEQRQRQQANNAWGFDDGDDDGNDVYQEWR